MELLECVGLYLDNDAERKLYAGTVDPDVTVLSARAVGIPEYTRDGVAEVGITGLDQIRESGHEFEDLLDLGCGEYRLILVALEDGDTETVAGVSSKIVATGSPHIARIYFEEGGIDAEVVEVTDTTELTPHVEMTDAIIDITSAGTTLRVNRLTVIDEVLLSSARLFARSDVVDDPKIQQLLMTLESVRSAEDRRYLMMNASRGKLDEVKKVILGLSGPTVMGVVSGSTIAVHVVMNERDVSKIVSDLRNVGASDILVTEIEWLVE